jgi:hypothetical protein
MAIFFFTATERAHAQITKLYDFVWPTAAAMWNLRWQVAGYVNVVPDATVEQLRARFTEGANIHGANLKRGCIEHTWDEQKDTFARILLINTIALYEGWIEEILQDLGKNTKALQKGLQFPGASGATSAIANINAIESTILKSSFHPALSSGRYYALSKLNEMLLCYRFFKELRNCDMHAGGIADQKLVAACAQFQAIATPAGLGVSEVPAHTAPALGIPVKISLRGVVGFSGIIFRMLATLDAELSYSKLAEASFIRKWKATHANQRMLSARPDKRKTQVERMAHYAGFPKPSNPQGFGNWLTQLGLTQF